MQSRRSVLATVGGLSGTLALAGCLGDDDDNDAVDGLPDDVNPRMHDFLEHARLYDRSIQDERGADRVDVDVGAGDGGLAFDPAAVRIDVGATVEWTWTGAGGLHDVASVGRSDFSFQSERKRDAGEEFEYTFDDGGLALYECRPHRAQRMFGGVEVLFEDDVVDAGDN